MKSFAWTILFLVFCVPVIGDGWIGVGENGQIDVMNADSIQSPTVVTTRVEDDMVQLTVACFGVLGQVRGTDEGEFLALSWPDAGVLGEIGHPQLPIIRRLVVVPDDATIDLNVAVGVQGTLDLGAANMPTRVFPRQAPIPKIEGARENAPFSYMPDAYSKVQKGNPESVRLTEVGIWRGHRIALLEITPVAYDPVEGTLTLTRNMDVHIDFVGGRAMGADVQELPNMGDTILNPPETSRGRAVGNYLIVTADAYAATMAQFATFKQGQGHTVTTHSVAAGTSAQDIKTYIEGQYADPLTRPDYLLLVGDTDTIPCWTGGGAGNPNTDLNYACMDGPGDWYPEIPIGRFSVRSTATLQNVIDKAVDFQSNFPGQGHLPNAVFMAGNDNYDITEGTHNYCIDTHMIPNEFVCDKVYEVTYGATPQDTRDSFNDGRYYGIFSGHGGEYSWADGPEFTQADVQGQDNDQMYSFICSFACVTGSYHLDECFTETWHRVADHGAVAIYGSSVNSYWDEDDIVQRRLFDGIYDNALDEVSPAWQAAMVELLAHYGATSTVQRYYEMYNLMGDPSTPLPESGCGFDMCVTPGGSLGSEGQQGGPFTPDQITYSVNNKSASALDYRFTVNVNWIDITPATGSIQAGATQNVVVSINANANVLGIGLHEATVTIENLTSHSGDTTRTANLQVGVPVVIYEELLDTDPGWTVEGEWAFGVPTGQGGDSGEPDPTSGFSGSHVYGYNLNGDYVDDMPEYNLTSTAFDCSTLTKVSLRYQRWLGVERNAYDHARVWVSPDQANWTEVWANGNSSMSAGSWEYVEHDISEQADREPTLYLRWSMGTTDGSVIYCGWNIDDIEIWGLQMEEDPCPLDVNDDGVVDIQDFLLAWCDPACMTDVDHDGRVTILDYLEMEENHFGPCPE